ncbi:MAG TPA: hypothetical protein PKK48_06005, partial [Phycisphaerae bacterium]|nr:hypothetical protein [Phycisphaerae bacterium]
ATGGYLAGQLAPLADDGPYIITIDRTTGAVTRGALLDVDDLASLAYNATTGIWYGVVSDAAGDILVRVNMTTGVTTAIGVLNVTSAGNIVGVTGLDYEDGVLYAVTADTMYTVSTKTAGCKKVRTMSPALPAEMSGLAGDSTAEGKFWATAKIGDMYYLLLKQNLPSVDMDKIIIAGTVAGQILTDGDINLIEMGFLWGQITVAQNLDNLIMRNGGGAVLVTSTSTYYVTPSAWDGTYDDAGDPVTESMSRITVGGTLGSVYTRSGTLYSAIQVEGDQTVAYPTDDLAELETRVSSSSYDARWLAGDLVDFTNDTKETAQFLSHPTGDFSLSGTLVANYDSGEDWYAISLLAGQTVVIDGQVNSCVLKLYDSLGNYMGSYGYETEEDEGTGSKGTTLEALTFTALEAGIYYILLEDTSVPGGTYSLNFTNATAACLGAVSVIGNYNSRSGSVSQYDFYGTGMASSANIAVKNGGNIGAISISGESYAVTAYAIGGGDLIAFQAGQMGELSGTYYYGLNEILSDGNIGKVSSTTGMMTAVITAGNKDGLYNKNAFIQNVYSG